MNSLLGEGPVKKVFAGGRGQNVPQIILFSSEGRYPHARQASVMSLDPPPRAWPDTRGFAK